MITLSRTLQVKDFEKTIPPEEFADKLSEELSPNFENVEIAIYKAPTLPFITTFITFDRIKDVSTFMANKQTFLKAPLHLAMDTKNEKKNYANKDWLLCKRVVKKKAEEEEKKVEVKISESMEVLINPPSQVLYVSKLPVSITKKEITKHFEQWGIVENVVMITSPKKVVYAFVKFFNLFMAKHAMKESQLIQDTAVVYGYGLSTPSKVLWVGGLGPWVDARHLKSKLQQFGEVVNFEWPTNKNFAYVEYTTLVESKKAWAKLQGMVFVCKKLSVDYSDHTQMASNLNFSDIYLGEDPNDDLVFEDNKVPIEDRLGPKVAEDKSSEKRHESRISERLKPRSDGRVGLEKKLQEHRKNEALLVQAMEGGISDLDRGVRDGESGRRSQRYEDDLAGRRRGSQESSSKRISLEKMRGYDTLRNERRNHGRYEDDDSRPFFKHRPNKSREYRSRNRSRSTRKRSHDKYPYKLDRKESVSLREGRDRSRRMDNDVLERIIKDDARYINEGRRYISERASIKDDFSRYIEDDREFIKADTRYIKGDTRYKPAEARRYTEDNRVLFKGGVNKNDEDHRRLEGRVRKRYDEDERLFGEEIGHKRRGIDDKMLKNGGRLEEDGRRDSRWLKGDADLRVFERDALRLRDDDYRKKDGASMKDRMKEEERKKESVVIKEKMKDGDCRMKEEERFSKYVPIKEKLKESVVNKERIGDGDYRMKENGRFRKPIPIKERLKDRVSRLDERDAFILNDGDYGIKDGGALRKDRINDDKRLRENVPMKDDQRINKSINESLKEQYRSKRDMAKDGMMEAKKRKQGEYAGFVGFYGNNRNNGVDEIKHKKLEDNFQFGINMYNRNKDSYKCVDKNEEDYERIKRQIDLEMNRNKDDSKMDNVEDEYKNEISMPNSRENDLNILKNRTDTSVRNRNESDQLYGNSYLRKYERNDFKAPAHNDDAFKMTRASNLFSSLLTPRQLRVLAWEQRVLPQDTLSMRPKYEDDKCFDDISNIRNQSPILFNRIKNPELVTYPLPYPPSPNTSHLSQPLFHNMPSHQQQHPSLSLHQQIMIEQQLLSQQQQQLSQQILLDQQLLQQLTPTQQMLLNHQPLTADQRQQFTYNQQQQLEPTEKHFSPTKQQQLESYQEQLTPTKQHQISPLQQQQPLSLPQNTLNTIPLEYPLVWSGGLDFKGECYSTDLHLISGSMPLVNALLSGDSSLQISQKLRLDCPKKVDELVRRVEMAGRTGSCILFATTSENHLNNQSTQPSPTHPSYKLSAFLEKTQAAAVIFLGSANFKGILHFIPPSQFADEFLVKEAPQLLDGFKDGGRMLVILMKG